jgi:CheY-like chemotaxis protein
VADVSVCIGPVSAPSGRAWLAAATETLAEARRRDLGVPPDVLDAFDHYLDLWARELDGEVFQWTGTIDALVLRRLASQWARLAAMARDDPAASGLRPAAPEGGAFFDALAVGLADALARADDRERFAPKFEEVVPDFDGGPHSAASADAGTRRVLLVDDNPDIRLLVRIGLESSGGFEVVGEACDGQEAVDAFDRGCPDVVLLDLAMPVMDGFEALPRLKRRCPECRVVVYSASDSPSHRSRIAEAGGDGYLRKDAAIADVVEALRAV